MTLVVKFGGSSVATIERIQAVANRVIALKREAEQLVVVVSAMSGETDRLLALGRQASAAPHPRELDALVATGEQASAALLAMTLESHGVAARSMTAHQAGIRTTDVHMRARIDTINTDRMQSLLAQGSTLIVAGFQGLNADGDLTTLGRGGSDTSAVALAAALQAERCVIFTDVDGVYTTDPRVCPRARKIERISFTEMLELASLGAKVLQIRSVELAMKFGVQLEVRSSFTEEEGTIVGEETPELERVLVAGVAADSKTAKITLRGVPDQPGHVAGLLRPLADAAVSVDMIIQNISNDGSTDITFTVAEEDLGAAETAMRDAQQRLGATSLAVDRDVAKVSVVGLGMRTHAGVAANMFELLAEEGINILAITTSEIKTSCLVRSKYAELAVRALHRGFGLDAI